MACNNLGLWAFNSNPVGLCDVFTDLVEVYGTSINVGELVFSGSPCDPIYPGDYLEPGFYSNNIIIFETTTSTGPVSIVSISSCFDEYCIQNTESFNQTYIESGTHNGFDYFTGQSYSSFIFYSTGETRWCLSEILDGSCSQFGPYNSTSLTPDLDDTVMYSGPCITTTTTTNPCSLLDIDAVFDCYIPPTPSVTPTNTPTPTPTPTPSTSAICRGRGMNVFSISISPTPSPSNTPTPTPTPMLSYSCIFSGEVIFNSINEIIQCANSKKFKDCFTGIDYYTSDLVLVSGTTQAKEGYVYSATINGQGYCVIYDGLYENISGVDNISLITEIGSSFDGACLECIPNLTPTPTPTSTPTPTPTPSSTPCVRNKFRITNDSPSKISVQYFNCDGSTSGISIDPNSSVVLCSTTTPISNNPQNTQITQLPFVCQ